MAKKSSVHNAPSKKLGKASGTGRGNAPTRPGKTPPPSPRKQCLNESVPKALSLHFKYMIIEKNIPNNIKFTTITLLALCKFNFKSFRRFLIFAFHYSDFINIKDFKSTSEITNEKLVSILDLIFNYKIRKKDLYCITQCSKNTFNKKLKNYLTTNKLNGRRKFSLTETYSILNEWQGEGEWGSMEAIKKEKLANFFSNGDYKKVAKEIELIFGKEFYKNNDKFSPKEVKKFLKHIDEIESEESKRLLGLGKTNEKISIWIFVILIGFYFWDRRKHTRLS